MRQNLQKRNKLFVFIFTLLFSIGAFAADTEFRLYLTGGAAGAETFTPFLADAGHGNIVVLKASEYAKDWYDENLPKYGDVKSVTTLIIRDRATANSEEIYNQIIAADGLFIAGGNQRNYHNYWRGTLVEKAMNEQLQMNTPVGGSSAGLAILGEFYYSAKRDGDPVKTNFLKTPFLKGVITDTHFKERDRFDRLRGFVNDIKNKYGVQAKGIGVDEATTLMINRDGDACVSGRGSVWVLEYGKDYQSYGSRECIVQNLSNML